MTATTTTLEVSRPTTRLALLAPTALLFALPFMTLHGQHAGKHGNWQGSVGVLGGSVASYYGSDARRTLGAPVAEAMYRNRLLITSATSTTLGAGIHWLFTNGALRTSLGFTGIESRPERRADVLAGMDGRSGGAFGTAIVAVNAGPAAATATTMIGLTSDAGNMQSLEVQVGGSIAPRLSASIGTTATFGDRRNMAFDFGITEKQAARRQALLDAGDRRLRDGDAVVFEPKGGFKELRHTAQVAYAIFGSWQAVGMVSEGRLASRLADSPLARKSSAVTAAAGFAYRF